MAYLLLFLAIITEVTATLLLKASDGWVKWEYGVGSINPVLRYSNTHFVAMWDVISWVHRGQPPQQE